MLWWYYFIILPTMLCFCLKQIMVKIIESDDKATFFLPLSSRTDLVMNILDVAPNNLHKECFYNVAWAIHHPWQDFWPGGTITSMVCKVYSIVYFLFSVLSCFKNIFKDVFPHQEIWWKRMYFAEWLKETC